MIPQRTLSNDFDVNELRERVAACRKRLRVKRLMHKPVVGSEFNGNSEAPKATFLDDETGMRESFRSTEISSAAHGGNSNAYERLPVLGSHEVGIT